MALYLYDLFASLTYPSGHIASYSRNSLGQINSITFNGTPIITARSYRADGLLSSQTYGNTLVDSRSYDQQGRMQSWSTGTLDSRNYTYDAAGNITGINTRSYGYDALDRLNSEPQQAFTYDGNSNRLSDSAGAYQYTANSNRMTASPAGTVTLDAAGHTTAIGNRAFTYNQAGKLTAVSDNGTQLAQYGYRFDGQRTHKTRNGATTYYHYNQSGNLIAEADATGTTLKEYVWDDAARPLAQIEAGQITYLHPDHLSTPRLGTDASGALVWQWDSNAFGDSAPVLQTRTVNLRFPGQYFDAETGLYQNWHRTYLPTMGRYAESDPIGLAGGGNAFAYVEGDPIGKVDSKGLELR